MSQNDSENKTYPGFELGPIRPPSEARSLLVRTTRNCPWNRCLFCPVYKTEKFSVRSTEHVKNDIDLVHKCVQTIKQLVDVSGRITQAAIQRAGEQIGEDEWEAFSVAANWVIAGDMRSVFLQDADSLVIKPADLVEILTHLKRRFPSIKRVTSYARAKTIVRRRTSDLEAIREAGLDRIHIGLESGSNRVLKMVDKGSTKEIQIEAGLKVKRAGMELSEYVMPGLGGQDLSATHAIETADAINQIDPDFLRIRTLAIPPGAPLHEKWQSGEFKKCPDVLVADELLSFIGKLNGITSVVKSDHVLNLFVEIDGRLPEHKDRMMAILKTYLAMDPEEQRLYQVGRRMGVFHRLGDLENTGKVETVKKLCVELEVTPENVDRITDRLMTRFV